MCGLVAAFSPGPPLAPDALAAPLRALAHRGPDGEGQWLADDRRVALGHRRLAIIDRAHGQQPLTNEDGTVVAIVSGELYDHVRIRERLRARGHRFRTRSDSEILVHLYEDHGVEAVHELRGEFALILWDARRRLGFVARDRFGIRPLLHARVPGAHGEPVDWFASEAKALFAAGAERAWDPAAVIAAAQMQYPLPSRTLFAGIRQIEPGELAIVGEGRDGLARRRYWDLDYPREADRPPLDARGEADAIAAVAASFDEAVRLRLAAEVPLAFQLSGGLDSTAVVASAAAQLDRPPVCFTVGFDRPGYDERHLAEASAAHLGAELHVVSIGPAAIVAELPDAVARAEGLAINGHIAAKHRLARTIREAGFGVVLTGEGSDEVFAGYAHLRRDHYLGQESRVAGLDASNRASAGLMLAHGDGLELAAVARALGYVPAWMAAKASLGRRVTALLADEFLAEHQGPDRGSTPTIACSPTSTSAASCVAALASTSRPTCGRRPRWRPTSSAPSATGSRWPARSRAACPSSITCCSSGSVSCRSTC